jgi:hypothetical protein
MTATTRSSSLTPLRLRLLLLAVIVLILMPNKVMPSLLSQIRMATRLSKNLLQCQPTMETVTPSRVVTVRLWRASAKSLSRRRKELEENYED